MASIRTAFFMTCLVLFSTSASLLAQGGSALNRRLPDSNVPGRTAQAPEAAPVDIEADELEYRANNQILYGKGNVVVTQGSDELRANEASLNRVTGEIIAKGDIFLRRNGETWRGEELTYNFKTREIDTGQFEAFSDPFYIRAETSQRDKAQTLMLENAHITTCEGEDPDFLVTMSSASIDREMVLRAKNMVFYLGGVPFFWLPYGARDLDDKTNIDIVPGYSSEMGAFLLTAYNYRLSRSVRAATRLDFRSDRGIGIGQDFRYEDKEAAYKGDLYTYYTQDSEPYDDAEEEAERPGEVEENRGRVRLSHSSFYTDRDYLLAEINWLSDEDIIEDFFDKEFRLMPIPENRVSFTHRGDGYTFDVLLKKRINDWHNNVDRMPELSLRAQRNRIPGTHLYYEGQHSGVALERLFPEKSSNEDYDTVRFDSQNMVYYPTRNFGFLNVIPRVGYQGTHYSNTREVQTTVEEVVETNTNGVQVVSVQTNRTVVEGDAEFRSVPKLGVETSFKAFRKFHDDPLWGNFRGFRHVVEPFANYTYIPEPNVLPSELFQYDAIDRVGEENSIRFGVRNKWQTRGVAGQIIDLVDVVVSTKRYLEPLVEDGEEKDFGPLKVDGEFRLVEWLPVDFELEYDFEDSELDRFNTQLSFLSTDYSRMFLEYRYQLDQLDQLTVAMNLFPYGRFSMDAYWRYDAEESQLQEHEYVFKTKNDCVGYGIGYREIYRQDQEDDQLVYGVLWLTAFPEGLVQLGR